MRLKQIRTWRVPHSLAFLGALLLTASLLAGAPNRQAPVSGTGLAGQPTESVQPASAREEGVATQAVKNGSKKFRVKLFLFRR